MSAVSAAGLSRRYGRRWALANVGFDVPEGALVMVAGRNGSGKTTLLRILSTALRPDMGTVRIFGQDVSRERELVRQKIALLGHRTHLYEPLTAMENLVISARFLGRDTSRPRLISLLEEVGLADREGDSVQTFSAGMRQRLALARALQQEPKVLLLDEPYGHLDPPGFLMVDGLLQRMRREGVTVLMSTHLIARGRTICDHGLVLDAGRLTFSGKISDMPVSGAEGFAEGA